MNVVLTGYFCWLAILGSRRHQSFSLTLLPLWQQVSSLASVRLLHIMRVQPSVNYPQVMTLATSVTGEPPDMLLFPS